MIWFVIGGVAMVLILALRTHGVGRVPTILSVAQQGLGALLTWTIINFVWGALLFGTPLWLIFGR